MIRRVPLSVAAMAFLLLGPNGAETAPPSEDAEAAALVHRALTQEIDGSQQYRSELLREALTLDPDCAEARWHSGYVDQDGRWVRFTEFPKRMARSQKLQEYQQRREAAPKSRRGQMELAGFCRRNRMPRRQRAHVTAALKQGMSGNDARLLSRLGFQLVNGRWIAPAELEDAKETARIFADGLRRWAGTLEQIDRRLDSPTLPTRQLAEEELKAISDPAALPAMELYLATGNLAKARLLVETLGGMPTHWAGVFLARQAVFSPFKTVREEAAEKLQQRPAEQYAPVLLAELETPIEPHVNLYIGSRGVSLSQVLLRENQDFQQIIALRSDTRFFKYLVRHTSPVRRAGRSNKQLNRIAENEAVSEAVLNARLKAYAVQRAVDLHNDVVGKRSDRILAALRRSTRLNLREPEEWWQWWTDYNELYEQGEKPRQYVYQENYQIRAVPTRPVASCLLAGTLVWTDRGAIPVERVKVGDLALCKDVETGELAYQPVLRTTVRPERELLRVRAGDTEFEATGGHVFWISGEGWLKLRDVKPGMPFHGVAGPVTVDAIEPGGTAKTYNLVVADFHSYFVGESLILSHDPTFARPTDLRVPGLLEHE